LTRRAKQQFLLKKMQDRALQVAPRWQQLLLQGIVIAKRQGGSFNAAG
jgi:hypothetical protein